MGADEIDAGKDPLKYAPDVYLLDTSTLPWAIMEPARLSEAARAICQNPNKLIAVSVVSLGNRDQSNEENFQHR